MKATVPRPNGKKNFVSALATKKKAEIFGQKVTFLLLIILMPSLLVTYGGCASSPEGSKISLPSQERLDNYIQTANHLTEEQKKKLARRRPFVGMTMEEANLAMYRESTDAVLSGKAFRAVYIGDAGIRYYLEFQGDPPRVVNWSQFSRDQIELMDPEKLRPSPPGIL